jgi:hypothetical protein
MIYINPQAALHQSDAELVLELFDPSLGCATSYSAARAKCCSCASAIRKLGLSSMPKDLVAVAGAIPPAARWQEFALGPPRVARSTI